MSNSSKYLFIQRNSEETAFKELKQGNSCRAKAADRAGGNPSLHTKNNNHSIDIICILTLAHDVHLVSRERVD